MQVSSPFERGAVMYKSLISGVMGLGLLFAWPGLDAQAKGGGGGGGGHGGGGGGHASSGHASSGHGGGSAHGGSGHGGGYYRGGFYGGFYPGFYGYGYGGYGYGGYGYSGDRCALPGLRVCRAADVCDPCCATAGTGNAARRPTQPGGSNQCDVAEGGRQGMGRQQPDVCRFWNAADVYLATRWNAATPIRTASGRPGWKTAKRFTSTRAVPIVPGQTAAVDFTTVNTSQMPLAQE